MGALENKADNDEVRRLASVGSARAGRRDLEIHLDGPTATLHLPDPKPSFEDLDPAQLHSLVEAGRTANPRLGATRLFDIVAGTALLLAALPVIVVAAVMVRLSSTGSVFYASRRYAHRSGTFGAWKLRTMVDEHEQRRILDAHPDLAEQLERECKLLDDPRVTTIGRFLRRTSLDELPQLWNVVRGDMSLVGPRPKTLEEGPRYGPALEPILAVRPGLTGLWQTSGRNDLPFEARIELDLHYVANRSLLGDIGLCLVTVRQFFSAGRHGAY